MEYFKKVGLLVAGSLVGTLACVVLAPVIVCALAFCVLVLALTILVSPILSVFVKRDGFSIKFGEVELSLDNGKSNDV